MLKRYIKEELLTEVSTFCCRDKRLFLLKPAAIRLLEGFHGCDIPYKAKPSTLNFKTVTHDLMVQYIVAKGCQNNRYINFITETEQSKSTMRKVRRFDAIVQTNENTLVGIEMEASSKTILHRRDCLHATQEMIKKEVVDYVLYFSHKRRFLKDAERVHQKLIANNDNHIDEQWVKDHIKLVYARDTIDDLYATFWQH